MGTKLICFDFICICKIIRFSQTKNKFIAFRQTKIYFQTNSKIEGKMILFYKNDILHSKNFE